jgi:hypothetical protein
MNYAISPVAAGYQRQTPTLWQAIGRSIWRALEQSGQRRAQRELRELAQRQAPFDPALAQQLFAAAQSLSNKEPS